MNTEILGSFLVSMINEGMNGIRQKDLNKIISTIDFIDKEIENINAILQDPQFSMNDEVLANNTRLREIISNFGYIFRIYQSYLQETNAITPYNQWFNKQNQNQPFNGKTPSAYLNGLQPIWYVGRDIDNDGTYEEIIPEYTPGGQPLNWNSSMQPSAVIYRAARGLVQGGALPPSGAGGIAASPTNVGKRVNVGGCTNPKYSFRIRQSFDPLQPSTKAFFGFRIKSAPTLQITMLLRVLIFLQLNYLLYQ